MSVTDGNLDLIGPLATLSIKETTVEPVIETVEGEADYKLLPGERLFFFFFFFFQVLRLFATLWVMTDFKYSTCML